jgi:uncharacterized protein YfaS (alpha-2-macroglobulin family)
MKKYVIIILSFVILVSVIFGGLWFATDYYMKLPDRISQHETIVLGQNRLAPGSQAALRVVTRDTRDGTPLENAEIRVSLQPEEAEELITVFSGRTDESGTAQVQFEVPAEPLHAQTMVIETNSSLGSDRVERPVTIERDYKVLLTTDKPLYQPGQIIHIRTLTLGAFDLVPAAAEVVEIIIADGKGNKVFRKTLTTSEWGVAAVDFQLASEVNSGAYLITAELGNTASEKTVTVENYVLPKFDISIDTEKSFYLPGERVNGTLQANYFFGKPVAGGEITLEGYTFDVERATAITLQGITDEAGNFEFSFDLPTYLTGTEFEGSLARFYLQAAVTDLAKHSETGNHSFPVSKNALIIEAIPEGGQIKPGVENLLYVLTSYPDGTPAATTLDIEFYNAGRALTIKTGNFGLAAIPFIPTEPWQEIGIQARDSQGNSNIQEFYFEGRWEDETVLLRPDKPVYYVGETLNLSILTSASVGTVYFDIIRANQTVNTQAVDITAGLTSVAVDLTPDLYGTLELHAYKILRSGHIVRDTRLVVVDNANDLNLNLWPNYPEERVTAGELPYFKPGETATLDLTVRDWEGSGHPAAIGLAVVDEAVFALAEQDPGFAKLYFLLESELLQPKYDLHGFSVPDLVGGLPISSLELVAAIETSAQASLAAAIPQRAGFSLEANSHDEAIQRISERQRAIFKTLSTGLFGVFVIISLIYLTLGIAALVRGKMFGRGFGLSVGVLVFPFLLLWVWPHPWAANPLEKLSVFLDWISWRGEIFLLVLAGFGLIGLIILIVTAIRHKDAALAWKLGLIPVFIGILIFMGIALSESQTEPDTLVFFIGTGAFVFIPFAFLLRFAGFVLSRQRIAAIGSLPVATILLIGAFIFTFLGTSQSLGGGEMLLEQPMEAMEMADGALEVEVMKEAEVMVTDQTETANSETPRLRQYFPETMLWLPEDVTDENGDLQLEFLVADSITTWRITALASTQEGRLGSATVPLRVFQDFFIDLDLPVALTVGDEISIPVGVFNYLPEPQNIRLELASADWFDRLDRSEKTVEIAANDITVVYFKIRVTDFGRQPFKVTAWGSKMSDAIQKDVQVYPDGKQIHFTHSDRLTPSSLGGQGGVQEKVEIPPEAISGTQKLTVKIYPGIVSQVVEGLDSILQMPYGCFEQTSSTTYPNVLVLDYLKFTNQAAPEIQFKAEEYINLGYQRLTTFEVGGGGFSLFGDPPPDRMLTAYGLQEFSDMSRVHNVDPALIQRTAEWLFVQQASNGSWENDRGLVHEQSWANLGDDRLPVTAYIVWGLADAGFTGDPRTQNGISYLKENALQAADPYVVALVANALVAVDINSGAEITPMTLEVLDQLAGMAIQDGNGATWRSGVATFMGSEGQTGSIETTALAALAFLRANRNPELANAALTALIQQKDSFGTWYSTQATVLTLKALIQSVRAGSESLNATVTVNLNDGQIRTVTVTPENSDVVQLLTFDDINIGSENEVDLAVAGEGNLMYQISGSYYLPWDAVPKYPQLTGGTELVDITLTYDRMELVVNDTVGVNVVVTLNEGQAESALIDLGLPPGFSVEAQDLAALVARFDDIPPDYGFPTIERYELTGRQILIYVSNLTADNPLEFSYRLRAKFPLTAQTPASNAYDYYNPDVQGAAEPQLLVVKP